MALTDELIAEVQRWIAADCHPDDTAELQALLNAGDSAALQARFAGPLAFGTAGLRGPLQAGPAGMNAAVVRRTAAGLAAHLHNTGAAGGIVVIGYDARHRSAEFAADSAAVFAATGFDARLLPAALPTPVLAFAVQYLSAVAGVMVTASHNPPLDNGYKVYAADGAQIIGPADQQIQAAIAAGPGANRIALSETYTVLDQSLQADYVTAVAGLLRPNGPRDIRIVHTSLHGVGAHTVRSVFSMAGFAAPIEVAEQSEPDPAFPTVAFPNPEEPGAMDLALAKAAAVLADLVIANDPDADRCAVAVPGDHGWQLLTGDEVGVLLADWLIAKGVTGTYATTIVSSELLSKITERHGVAYRETLTGFKWISRAAPDLAYGYEEALGYAVAPAIVRDKDGISAALLIAEMAAHYKAIGSSLPERLEQLAKEYGRYLTRQLSWRVKDLAMIEAAMQGLRSDPPATLLGEAASVGDLLPDNDVLSFRTASARVVVRPSGTEPKLKAYLELVGPVGAVDGSDDGLVRRLGQLADEVSAAVAL